MTTLNEQHQKIAATISEDLRRSALEAARLQRCEHDHDFDALVNSICEDLMLMVTKYQVMMQELYAKPAMSEEEVNKTIKALLKELPASYPPYIFSKSDRGYWLEIERTIIFRRASAEEAIKHTQNYVEARKASPNLPIGVIYGIYD